MADGQREDQFLVTLALTDPVTGETRNLGLWDKLDGGELDSEETVYRAAGGRRKSLGGGQVPGNTTLQRNYELVRDHAIIGWLLALVGRGEGSIGQAPTNAAYAAAGGAIGRIGTLKRCTPPPVDSESNSAAMIELEFTIESMSGPTG